MRRPPARSTEQRLEDVRRRLEEDVDAWVATADADGGPYMIPLSFLWDGEALLVATPGSSRTARNLRANGRVRLGVGLVRDVVLIEGAAVPVDVIELDAGTAEAFAAKTGFDPRQETERFLYFRITPRRVQAWREANELDDRLLMSDGRWVDGS